MAVISSAILESESERTDVSAESLMVLSFILKLLKIKKYLDTFDKIEENSEIY